MKGSKVKVKYDGKWYSGVITQELKRSYKIDFEDGDCDTVQKDDPDLKLLKKKEIFLNPNKMKLSGEFETQNIDFNTKITFSQVFNPKSKYVKDYIKRSGNKNTHVKGLVSRATMYGVLNSFINMENLAE